MIDAVLMFGALNVLFEFVLLCMLRPRTRLRVLGNPVLSNLMHTGFLSLNLLIHWGTLIGTMSAVLAFVSSIVTVNIARVVFGRIEDGRHYHVGFIKYSVEELK